MPQAMLNDQNRKKMSYYMGIVQMRLINKLTQVVENWRQKYQRQGPNLEHYSTLLEQNEVLL